MIKFILGAAGSGKTKWLIDRANEEIESGNGNLAFVEVEDDHIFSLDYNVRLINVSEYNLTNLDNFYGFLTGLLAMDYDLEKIYVDGIYKIFDLKNEDLVYLYNKLNALDLENRAIYINVDYALNDLPEELKESAIELE